MFFNFKYNLIILSVKPLIFYYFIFIKHQVLIGKSCVENCFKNIYFLIFSKKVQIKVK